MTTKGYKLSWKVMGEMMEEMRRELEAEETVKCKRCGALVEVEFLDTTLWDRDLEMCAMCAEDIAREEKWSRNTTK